MAFPTAWTVKTPKNQILHRLPYMLNNGSTITITVCPAYANHAPYIPFYAIISNTIENVNMEMEPFQPVPCAIVPSAGQIRSIPPVFMDLLDGSGRLIPAPYIADELMHRRLAKPVQGFPQLITRNSTNNNQEMFLHDVLAAEGCTYKKSALKDLLSEFDQYVKNVKHMISQTKEMSKEEQKPVVFPLSSTRSSKILEILVETGAEDPRPQKKKAPDAAKKTKPAVVDKSPAEDNNKDTKKKPEKAEKASKPTEKKQGNKPHQVKEPTVQTAEAESVMDTAETEPAEPEEKSAEIETTVETQPANEETSEQAKEEETSEQVEEETSEHADETVEAAEETGETEVPAAELAANPPTKPAQETAETAKIDTKAEAANNQPQPSADDDEYPTTPKPREQKTNSEHQEGSNKKRKLNSEQPDKKKVTTPEKREEKKRRHSEEDRHREKSSKKRKTDPEHRQEKKRHDSFDQDENEPIIKKPTVEEVSEQDFEPDYADNTEDDDVIQPTQAQHVQSAKQAPAQQSTATKSSPKRPMMFGASPSSLEMVTKKVKKTKLQQHMLR